ncbi:Rab guanyl-nucleotide exchange factor [Fragilaria crotonensis]|nr:Rab guanyl-nucleotide exchange factor [Fragilaria crotonensis]
MVLITPAPETGQPSPDNKKKTRLETSNAKDAGLRRLVEYFVVVSSIPNVKVDGVPELQESTSYDGSREGIEFDDDEDIYVDDFDFQPKITARFPLQDHHENPLHESVTFFCYPSGAIQLRMEKSMPKAHFFAATGGSGKQMYGTCLTLWEPYVITAKTKKGSDKGKKKEVYLPKCLVLLSTYPYLTAFREFLTQLNRLSKMGEMTLPLERYICNFCAEIPAPAPGAFEVQTTILDSVIKIWAPPHNQPIAWVALPFSHLFECLDVDNIITVWHCLALERQVLLTSTQLSLLTTCTEIFISLLFPMRWSHAYIPVLPHFMVPILSAPMPFFCGINKANLASALCDLSPDCVVVDLDMNLVTLGPQTPQLPPLPPQLESLLRARLDDNVGMVFREARCLTRHDNYSERGLHLPTHTKQTADAMWEGKLCLFDEAFHLAFTPEESRKNLLNGNDTSGLDASERDGDMYRMLSAAEKTNLRSQSQWDAVQEAFLDSFVYMLRNYRKYLVFPSKDNEGSYGGAGFRSIDFVQGQRYDMKEFLDQFVATQMFDNFITKRLYGSGEADVAFFDIAVDRFLKTQGILSNVDVGGRFLRASGRPLRPVQNKPNAEPLIQSARVHRKLKTIVPPEPSAEALPPIPVQKADDHVENGIVMTEITSGDVPDDISVGSGSTQGTHSTRGTSKGVNKKKTLQDQAAEILEKSKYRYTYPTFPSEFNPDFFGEPRPLPSAVIAEFDRQKKDAARFRRKGTQSLKGGNLRRQDSAVDPDVKPTPEVATFTLFFMAFSAVIGKELMDISQNPLLAQDRTILATYTHGDEDSVYTETSVAPTDDSGDDLDYEQNKEGVAEMKSTRPDLGGLLSEDDDDEVYVDAAETDSRGVAGNSRTKSDDSTKGTEGATEETADDVSAVTEDGDFDSPKKVEQKGEPVLAKPPMNGPAQPRSRFTTSLSKAQIEEAQSTGRAQLALAFEMLAMVKKRGLKSDPEAYQCLVDACGRVGDTKRATELLSKMHEDGIVADGVVYSCLVSAFSAESAWKMASGSVPDEDLPEWANSTAVEVDWNKLNRDQSFIGSARAQLKALAAGADDDDGEGVTPYARLRSLVARRRTMNNPQAPKVETIEFYVTEPVEMQIELGENLLEIVYSDISVDTDNETCPRCNYLLTDEDVVNGWTPSDSQDYTTCCMNCLQRFVPHFRVQSTSPTFMGSKGPASPLMCERLSPWVLQRRFAPSWLIAKVLKIS